MTIIDKSTKTQTSYLIRVCKRSRVDPAIKVQKQKLFHGITLKKAQSIEKSFEYDCIEQVKEKESHELTFKQLVHLWYEFKYKEGLVSKETIGDYFNALEKWCFHILDKPSNSITKPDIKRILNTQKAEGISISYRKKFKSMINNVFNFGVDESYISAQTTSPTQGITFEREVETKPEILTLKQARLLLQYAKDIEHEWYPIWAFALLTGCRNGELYALEKQDIDLENNKIIVSKSFNNRRREIKSTKAGYYRTVPINDDLRALIIQLMNQNLDSNFILPRAKGWNKGYQAKALRTFLASVGLPSVKFHTLRACFATLLLQQGLSSAIIMKICGWADLKTMEKYIRLSGVDEDGATDRLKILPLNQVGELISLHNADVSM